MRAYLLAAFSLLVGILAFALLLTGVVWLALLLHLLSASAGGYAAALSDSRRSGEHWFPAAVAFCLPFAGPFSAFLLSESVKRKKTGRLSEEFAIYLSDAATFRESVPVADAEAPPAAEVVPMADILANPVSEAEQRVAVENLSSMETPVAIGALRKVIDSGVGEGRFFAMTALSRLEERLFAKLQTLEEAIEAGRQGGSDAFLEKAKAYLDFSYYQLAQDARRDEYLAKAREALGTAMEGGVFDPEAWIILGRIELLQRNGKAALDCFNAYLALAPESVKGLLWRAEAWFMLGEFDSVRDDCLGVLEFGGPPDSFRETVMFWAESTGNEWDPEDRSQTQTRGTRRIHTRSAPSGVWKTGRNHTVRGMKS